MTEQEWLDIFSKNLTELMYRKGYSQNILADSTGLSRASMHYYVTGRRIPGIRALINIAYELDVDVNDLIDFGDRIEG